MAVATPLAEQLVRVGDVTYHVVEAGAGEPVVFLHGLPESWYTWHYQQDALERDYHVLAVDLKGYGQSDTSDGDYSAEHVADELVALVGQLGVGPFNLVGRDWGALIGDFIAGRRPDLVRRYVRVQAPLTRADLGAQPQFLLCHDETVARAMLASAEQFIRMVYGERVLEALPETDLRRLADEFERPGVAGAVARYFRDLDVSAWDTRRRLYAAMTMPVLLLQGGDDPAQPSRLFEGAERLFRRARVQIIRDAGHFCQLEQPAAVREAIRAFLSTTVP